MIKKSNACNCTPKCKPQAEGPCTELLVLAAASLQNIMTTRLAPAYAEIAPNVKLRMVNDSRFDLVSNDLVVVEQLGSNQFNNINDLLNATHIAIGNPATVPSGVYSIEAMQFYGLYAQLQLRTQQLNSHLWSLTTAILQFFILQQY